MKKILTVFISLCFIFTLTVSNVYGIDDQNNSSETVEKNNINSENTDVSDIDNTETVEERGISDYSNNNEQKQEEIEDNESKDNIDTVNEEETLDDISSSVEYSTHVQDIGWQEYVKDGKTAGTIGKSKRLESIKIQLVDNTVEGSISYATHIQNLGWTNFVDNNNKSGTEGQSLRLEAIKIKLTGEIANYYDVYYRVHIQNYGWLDWASNGKAAGSASYSYRLEGIEIKLVKKGEDAPGPTNRCFVSPGRVYYSSHIADIGWQGNVGDGKLSGTERQSKRIEAIKLYLDNYEYTGDIQYNVKVQDYGWQEYKSNGTIAGTTGQKKQIEAIRINLSGEIANYYDVYYRVHVQEIGWLDWAKNDEIAGTDGYAYRVEAIQVELVPKGESAPGNTNQPYKTPGNIYYSTHVEDYGWMGSVADGTTSGTIGKSKRIEAIKINLGNVGYTGDIEYSTHVQNIGWQSYQKNGVIAGTTGQKLRVEAIKIKLTGDISNYYDVYYRAHVQEIGWLDWAKNDNKAGTEGMNCRIEAIEIILVEKDAVPPGSTDRPFVKSESVYYTTHVQNLGWTSQVSNGTTSGTTGKSYRLEAIKISLGNDNYSGNVEYSVHVQDYGWMNYASNGEIAGTENQSKRIEAIKIRLAGEIANYYDIYYRVYVQNIGWMDWTCNDNQAGTIGASFRIEAIQIKTYLKGVGAPDASSKACLTFKNNNGYLVCYDNNGNKQEDIQTLYTLPGTYDLRVNKATNVVTVLAPDGNGNKIIAYKRFICSVGYDTPAGIYYTPVKYRWRELMGPSYGQYSTRIVNGYLFHSVPYNRNGDIYSLSARMYNQLGTTCSHGCIRLTVADAKWIYDYCPLGTKVIIVPSGNDPLSKPSAQKIPLTQTWDPTDPAI